MTDISSQTLYIVAKELAATLNDARASLEAYAERSDQRVLLEKCADQLHAAHGVLRLVEVYGAALLAEEMEHVTRYLLSSDNDQKRQVDGLDALMRAMVQLPTYLERVLSGGRDLALVLLPLLNDLRSVRGSPLLSEGTLLLLNLKSDQPAQPQSQKQGEQAISVAQWARRLRPRFQIGLLGYIRGERTVQNLEILAKVAEKLEQIATTQPVFQLWWVIGAILEAVRANGLEGSATLKRLLGQADRQIKALYEQGEGRYCEDPPVDLLNNLLYYVARASTSGGRLAAVRASFKLSELLPVDDSIEHERESLSAPSVKLMRTVAAAIKEDLSKVKDVLDIFVRRGGGRSDELAPQLELLKKISDTLGVLGLGELRQRVQDEIAELAEIVTDGKAPHEDSLLKVAGVLLSVEDSLAPGRPRAHAAVAADRPRTRRRCLALTQPASCLSRPACPGARLRRSSGRAGLADRGAPPVRTPAGERENRGVAHARDRPVPPPTPRECPHQRRARRDHDTHDLHPRIRRPVSLHRARTAVDRPDSRRQAL
jgi:chemosensory pili system protein ChpA (sensor histidine kinase/response regulator)